MSRQADADNADFTPHYRSIQVGQFDVAIPEGILVAIGSNNEIILMRSQIFLINKCTNTLRSKEYTRPQNTIPKGSQ